jgi:hypothetical protein
MVPSNLLSTAQKLGTRPKPNQHNGLAEREAVQFCTHKRTRWRSGRPQEYVWLRQSRGRHQLTPTLRAYLKRTVPNGIAAFSRP